MNESVAVVMTTYSGDNQSALSDCLDSLSEQTRHPDEVIIVRDHNLPAALVDTIRDFRTKVSFEVRDICITDQGRGHARKVGVERAASEFIAIIDADDIACLDRLQRQVDFLKSNPEVDVVGGYVAEFETDPAEVQSVRDVPTDPEAIRQMAHYRCPINHPTVMFRRVAVLDVGNYREMEYGEDYELWCRLLANGKTLSNIPDILTKVRAANLVARRHGVTIACREMQLQRAIVASGFYGWVYGVANLCIRVPMRLLPRKVLRLIYQWRFRS